LQLETIKKEESELEKDPQWEEFVVDNRRIRFTIEKEEDATEEANEGLATAVGDNAPAPVDHEFIRPWPNKLRSLMSRVERAMNWKPERQFEPTEFEFSTSLEAARRNIEILSRYDYDLQRAIMGTNLVNTPLRPGSEFRPKELLGAICRNHPLWPRIEGMLTEGFTMPLAELPEVDRVQDVLEAIRYGNHKSTQKNPGVVWEMLKEEVERGWQLVLPCSSIPVIPGTIVSPLGLVSQNTINELGQTITKWRLTHDQSFKFQSKTSVNSRVRKEKLARCMYGTALRRFIHAIVHYRRRFGEVPLLMAKFDLKSAYRRAHFSGVSALQSIATSVGLSESDEGHQGEVDCRGREELAFVSLRFTFGGASNPSEFSTISEVIADLANTMAQHENWNPTKLQSEFITLTGDKPKLSVATTPFAIARELLVDRELSEFGMTDAYIDDIFTVFPLLSDEHFQRGRNAAPLAIDVFGRPVVENDPLPRDPMVATKKVMAEGTPTESLTVLGWEIDTRRLLIRLPEKKALEWDRDLKFLIKQANKGWPIGIKRLETIQGRNVNVATIVPGAMHFQSRMYSAIQRAKQNGSTRLKAEERRDLKLLRHLLAVARRGISLNIVVSRMPDHLGRSDAFEGGVGGYDLSSGRAWRLEIPSDLRLKKSQNFLEYLACMTQVVCMLAEGNWKPGDCFLSIGDNISALQWIRKSKFCPEKDPEQATHLALARYMTRLMADRNLVHFGQWLPGSDNGVADALSRQHDKTDEELTGFIVSTYPEQTPDGFQIRALPPEITSWALYWLRHTRGMREWPPAPFPRVTRGGGGGSSSCTTANSTMISSSHNLPNTNDTYSLAHLHNVSATTSGQSPRKDMITWLRAHAAPPLNLCLRPSSLPVGKIPVKTRMEDLRSFYSGK
jgi:hypothetical protein